MYIAADPGFDHIVSSHPCNTLVFPGIGASPEGENCTPKRRVDFYDPSGICDIGILSKPPILGIFSNPGKTRVLQG